MPMHAARPLNLAELKARHVTLPVCPSVFLKLQELMQQPKTTCGDLQKVIALEPALAAQVLKTANSAMFGLKRSVCSIDEAVLRLGLNEIWVVASALNAKQAYGAAGGWSEFNQNQWAHSLKMGLLAKALGERLNQQTADVFFTAGLLHDIGKQLFHVVDPAYADRTLDGLVHGHYLCDQEREAFGATHPQLGAELLRDWKVPAPVTRLVESHHKDPIEDSGLARSRCSFALANELAHNPKWTPEKGMTALPGKVPAETVLEIVMISREECLALAAAMHARAEQLLASGSA
ncbi:MAG: HDOD domain-containing protein [Planctomycetota bacterium]|nr:HDOD domain-containing protein [Planctomycetota bacterium]